ncbi:PREDICTED: uncharacterized protein LOC105556519, partial [Vollenhovia emeryi]|uniref:uncharacterized protein LOC105556519 n=1 Tax=Vollenhovia emeryi TaxID=411798 RepID=UPI0005F45932
MTSETIIDLVFTNMEMEIKVCHEPRITDHSAIMICWSINVEEHRDGTIIYRDYKRMNVEEFKRLLCMYLNDIEGDNIDREITLKEEWKGKQWFSQDIYQMVKQRDRAYRVARDSKNNEDWELFRQLRNKTVDICRKAKRDYLEEKLDRSKKDPKQMWEVLKEMLKGKVTNKQYEEIQCRNRVIRNVEEMADMFNYYFVDSINQLINRNQEEDRIGNVKYTNKEWDIFMRVEIEQLRKIVRDLKNKAGTEEGITVEIMKYVMDVTGEKVCEMLNRSLEEGVVPKQWKEAIVIPIPK